MDSSDDRIKGRGRVRKHRSELRVHFIIIHEPTQIWQLAALAGTLETSSMDVCCLSERCVQDSTSAITLRSQKTTFLSFHISHTE